MSLLQISPIVHAAVVRMCGFSPFAGLAGSGVSSCFVAPACSVATSAGVILRSAIARASWSFADSWSLGVSSSPASARFKAASRSVDFVAVQIF